MNKNFELLNYSLVLDRKAAIWVGSKIKKARKPTISELLTSFDIASGSPSQYQRTASAEGRFGD